MVRLLKFQINPGRKAVEISISLHGPKAVEISINPGPKAVEISINPGRKAVEISISLHGPKAVEISINPGPKAVEISISSKLLTRSISFVVNLGNKKACCYGNQIPINAHAIYVLVFVCFHKGASLQGVSYLCQLL